MKLTFQAGRQNATAISQYNRLGCHRGIRPREEERNPSRVADTDRAALHSPRVSAQLRQVGAGTTSLCVFTPCLWNWNPGNSEKKKYKWVVNI